MLIKYLWVADVYAACVNARELVRAILTPVDLEHAVGVWRGCVRGLTKNRSCWSCFGFKLQFLVIFEPAYFLLNALVYVCDTDELGIDIGIRGTVHLFNGHFKGQVNGRGLLEIGPVKVLVLELKLERVGYIGQDEHAERVVLYVAFVGRQVGAGQVVAAGKEVVVGVGG